MVFDFEKLTLEWLIQVGFNQKLLKPSKFSFNVLYFDTFSDIPSLKFDVIYRRFLNWIFS